LHNEEQGRKFGAEKEEARKVGENCAWRNLIICTLRHIFR
jgi:hypothetical protein